MPEPRADLTFKESSKILLRHAAKRWYVVLVGAVGGGFGAANELFAEGDLRMPSWIGWTLLGASILLAVFWAFHDYRGEGVAEIATVKTKARDLEERIQEKEETRASRIAIERELWGAEIERRFILHDEDPLSPEEKRRHYSTWRKGTADYLREILGPAAAARLYASKDGSVIVDIANELDTDHFLLDLEDIYSAGEKREKACGITKGDKFIIKRGDDESSADEQQGGPGKATSATEST